MWKSTDLRRDRGPRPRATGEAVRVRLEETDYLGWGEETVGPGCLDERDGGGAGDGAESSPGVNLGVPKDSEKGDTDLVAQDYGTQWVLLCKDHLLYNCSGKSLRPKGAVTLHV